MMTYDAQFKVASVATVPSESVPGRTAFSCSQDGEEIPWKTSPLPPGSYPACIPALPVCSVCLCGWGSVGGFGGGCVEFLKSL